MGKQQQALVFRYGTNVLAKGRELWDQLATCLMSEHYVYEQTQWLIVNDASQHCLLSTIHCQHHQQIQHVRQGPANQPFVFELNLKLNRALRFELIESFQLQRILIIKISNYKWSKRDVRNYIFLILILKHIKLLAYDHS